MPRSARYREIEVSGTPEELGQQFGEFARDEIQGFCEIALERVNLTTCISREKAINIARTCIDFADQYSSDMIRELRGMASAANVTLDDLMLLQVRNQLRPELDAGCTSFSTSRALTGDGVVAQNWDNDPLLDEFTVVLTRRPTDKPAILTVTQAGLISYIGLNDAGIGACLNTLPAASRDVGVPHYFTLRGIFESTSLDGAIDAVRRAHRAIPANIILSTPQGPADLEVTIDDIHVLRPNGNELVTHTNHCLHPELIPINAEFPELIQSKPRKRRVDYLLEQLGPRPNVDDFKTVLSDHDDYPMSICRHSNDDPETGFWQTVFSVIIETDARRLHVSRGTPCDHAYETYIL